MAAAASTVISPIVSMPRKSTRITFTTLRPPPSGSDRSTISSDTGSAVRFPPAVSARRNTVTPTAAAAVTRTARPAPDDAALEPVGKPPQDQHEQHGRQRLDRHLGQRQVGPALHDEQARHGVAGGAQQERGREPAVDRTRGQRRRHERDAHGHMTRRPEDRRPPGPAVAHHQRARREQRRRRQDHARVHRQRAALHHGGDPVGHDVEAPQDREVGLAAARHAVAHRQHAGDGLAGEEQAELRPRARRPTA